MADLFTKPVQEITYDDLQEFARTRPIEGERLDWKMDLSSTRITETICAMVNTEGGLILVGVGEEQRQGERTKGIAWPPTGGVKAGSQDALMSMCRTSYRPDYLPRHHLVPIPNAKNKYILVVRIDQWSAPQYLWHLEKGFLTRTGDQNRPAPPELVAALLNPRVEQGQNSLYTDWGMMTSGIDGIVQGLVAVMRYPRGAPAFGTAEKMALRKAVENNFGGSHHLGMIPKYASVAFEISFGPVDEKLTAWFSPLGVARIAITKRWSPRVSWRWIVGEAMMLLGCLQSDEIRSVYPNVQEGALKLGLINWPEEGIDTEGLRLVQPTGHELLKGHTVTEEFMIDPTTSWWGMVRKFFEHVLADARYLDYETILDGFEQGMNVWMAEYQRAARHLP